MKSSHQLSPKALETLTFVRYLYTMGLNEAERPEPFCTAAILMFHDSVELFLELAVLQPTVGFTNSKPTFIDYWAMQIEGDQRLTQKPAMTRFNKMRVDLKHHGFFQRKADIQTLGPAIRTFFVENCPSIFGFDFEEISFSMLVHDPEAHDFIERAESLFKSGDVDAAFDEIAKAFLALMETFSHDSDTNLRFNRHSWGARSVIERGFSRHFSRQASFGGNAGIGDAVRGMIGGVSDHLDDMQEQINTMETILTVLALGVSYSHYVRFNKYTPTAASYIDRNQPKGRGMKVYRRGDYTVSRDHFQLCLMFVVEIAIALERMIEI